VSYHGNTKNFRQEIKYQGQLMVSYSDNARSNYNICNKQFYLSARGAPCKFELLTAGDTDGDLDPEAGVTGLPVS
jgi:hypothetical protein